MDRQDKEQIAQEKYGKGYDDLSSNEQQSVGGTFGGRHNAEGGQGATGQSGNVMSSTDKEDIAQEKYGKAFDDLSTNEQKGVGGVFGGRHNAGTGQEETE